MGNFANDRGRIVGSNLFNLHAASGRGHDEHATCGAIDQCSEVDLADDRGGWRHKDASHWQIFNGEGKDCGGGCLSLCRTRGKFDSARLPSPADEDLRLDDHLRDSSGEEAFGDCASARGRSGNVGVGDGETGPR
jgi:hypothetical protein